MIYIYIKLMTTTVNFSDYLQKYIKYQNDINKLNEQIKLLKNKQKQKNEKILNILKKEKKNFIINGYTFKIKEKKEIQTISIKYLEIVLDKYFNNKEEVNKLIEYIKNNRKISYTEVLDLSNK